MAEKRPLQPTDHEATKKKVRSEAESETELDLRHRELIYQEALWNSIVREIMFQCPCTVVWKCQTTQGGEIVTFDHADDIKTLSIGKLMLPTDLLMTMKWVKTLITHVEYSAVLMSRRKLLHPGLPEPQQVDHTYYYHFGNNF